MSEKAPMRIVVTRDGVETDVTESVTRMYDLLVGSLDWGSCFLDAEDVAHVRRVQDAKNPEGITTEAEEDAP